jgi:hypothetical protein
MHMVHDSHILTYILYPLLLASQPSARHYTCSGRGCNSCPTMCEGHKKGTLRRPEGPQGNMPSLSNRCYARVRLVVLTSACRYTLAPPFTMAPKPNAAGHLAAPHDDGEGHSSRMSTQDSTPPRMHSRPSLSRWPLSTPVLTRKRQRQLRCVTSKLCVTDPLSRHII